MSKKSTRPKKTDAATVEQEPDILPLSLAGKWVAWTNDGMHIVGSGDTIEEAERNAAKNGEAEPMLEFHSFRYRQ